jgi:hypothetical protein
MAALFRYSLTTLFSLPATEVAAQMVVLANQGDELALHWIGRLVKRKELGRALVLEAAEAAGTVKALMSPHVPKRGTKFHFLYSFVDEADKVAATMRELGRSQEEADRAAKTPIYALAFLRLVEAGLHRRIKRCQLAECGKLFFGDTRAVWCSSTCGSKYRVRDKRTRDRQ